MTLSTLDPVPALILVDLQRGVLDIGIPGTAEVVERAAALARAFRQQGLPVALVNVDGTAPGRTDAGRTRATGRRPAGWDELAPELGAAPDDIRVTKRTWGAFSDTGLDEALRARAVTQTVVGGIATTAGVESTARAAHEHGYHVVLVADAMLDRDPADHDHAVERVFPRLGEVTDSAEVLRRLGER